MYDVLVDFHHSALLQSFILLFERRLGGVVFRPIGTEWFEKGYWKVFDHPATIQQFLGIGGATPDGSAKLNEVESVQNSLLGPAWYNCYDIESGETNKAITFDRFMEIPFDIVIASLPYHIEPFKRLCREHPNHPKLIYQIGNAWTVEAGLAPNIMASAKITNMPPDINFISYHQEFDTNIFRPDNDYIMDTETMPLKNIYSFINCFDGQGHFRSDWLQFLDIERSMPDWVFRSFGGQCRDGAANGSAELADKMREAKFIWHTKAGGDGYGHVLHNAAAVGRPVIVKKLYYAGKMGEALLVDGKTAIVIDGLTNPEIINKIWHYSEPSRYAEMCMNVYRNFRQVVDFDREFDEIKVFLANLK